MSAISDYLASSRTAHLAYQRHIPRKAAQGATLMTVPGNPELARASLQEASDWRAQANREDPNHLDPSWALDVVPHEKMMAFYAKELAK